MKRLFETVLAGFALAACLLPLAAAPTLADCGVSGAFFRDPSRIDVAFIGTFNGVRQEHTSGRIDPIYHWNVETAVLGYVRPGAFQYDGVSCHAAKFTVGQRYLIGYDSAQNIDAWSILAYRLGAGGSAHLVAFEAPRSAYASNLRVTRLSDALALMPLPETSTISPVDAASNPATGFAVLFGAAFLAAAALLARRRPRAKASVE